MMCLSLAGLGEGAMVSFAPLFGVSQIDAVVVNLFLIINTGFDYESSRYGYDAEGWGCSADIGG